MRAFTYDALPGRVVFGAGSRGRLADEVQRLGCSRVFLITDPATKLVAGELAEALGDRFGSLYADVQLHVPLEAVAAARDAARASGADCVVTVGGGSTTGYGKAIALQSDLPTLAVPTTYAGSEMTPIYGITSGGVKRTGRDVRVLPKVVLYDPELTVTLPPAVTAASGMNALAHCVEGLYAKDANPITSLMAEEAIRALVRGIPAAVRTPADLDARSEALFGAYLAGATLAVVGMALHHRICHVLGGGWNLPHAETHAVVLPQSTALVAAHSPAAAQRLSTILGGGDPAQQVFDLLGQLGLPTSLAEIGLPEAAVPDAVERVLAASGDDPLADGAAVRALLDRAHAGRRPGSHGRTPVINGIGETA